MSRIVEAKKIVALLGLVMAALVVLSAFAAPNAQAKKKGHHHGKHHSGGGGVSINTVQCPTGGSNSQCDGTAGNDHLVGRDDKFDDIHGGEGNDIYDGKGGSDRWEDFSATSNDTYLVPSTEFSDDGDELSMIDSGGSFDVLDFGAYKSTDFALSRDTTTDGLFMVGSGKRVLFINFFFTENTIDFFKFSDGALTADQVKSKVP